MVRTLDDSKTRTTEGGCTVYVGRGNNMLL